MRALALPQGFSAPLVRMRMSLTQAEAIHPPTLLAADAIAVKEVVTAVAAMVTTVMAAEYDNAH